MTQQEIKAKKAEIVEQLLSLSEKVKDLNKQKTLLIDELMNLECKPKLRILN